ncbi:MAG: TetR/AcrR family transcriptional regulator [Kordiimonadaceae bacterium]|nr:TetR/AcrR family transcriptional regulator [Kordiimonadaceae bacterium]MBO6569539.1 TetR/AcrR family transcriptional regulator [Kordiimonadaceae bacterium]MBO6965014.1 TetR/AcrR family transcriptional regulator [Kordiimonadaceae bacterium]
MTTAANAAMAETGAAQDQVQWVYRDAIAKPVQLRSEQSFLRFLDAAEVLLDDRSWTSLTIQDVVATADASVGSFYNRFEDKMALLHCLEDRLGADFAAAMQAIISECELCEDLLADVDGLIISLFMRLCLQRAGVIRALDLAQRIELPQPGAEDGEGFAGIGQVLDRAFAEFAEYLNGKPDCLAGATTAELHRALRETFWLTRENLLYGSAEPDMQAVHGSLRQHFFASLRFPA